MREQGRPDARSLERITTERLACERLAPGHLPELCQLLLDPRVVAAAWLFEHPPGEEDIAASLKDKIAHWERHGFGLWLLRDRATGAMVGRGGLQYTYTAGIDAVEAVWTIAPERWGQGLATEFARAALDAAFGPLGLLEVVAFTRPTNLASRRVMDKAGFRHEGEAEYAGLPHVLYRARQGA